MSDDPLHTPLRPRGWRERLRLRATRAQLATLLVVLAIIGVATWAWLSPPPPVTETVVEKPLPPRPAVRPAPSATARAIDDATPSASARRTPEGGKGAEARATTSGRDAAHMRRGVKIIDVSKLPPDDAPARSANAPEISVDARYDIAPLPRAPFKGLVEKSSFGPLPRVGAKGRQPWRAYARPVSSALLSSGKPKIAVLVTDVGLDAELAEKALQLPPEVSLALVPHLKKTARLGREARHNGHEFFLQVPMEPWGYPAVNPGPKTLLSSAPAEENRQRLLWLLGRATGYAGIVTYAGQKFLQAGEALSPVMHELKRRGLMAIDDGTAANSLLQPLGLVVSLPVLRADIRVPPGATPADARAAFDNARALAERKGVSLLVVSSGSDVLRELAHWLAGIAADDGIALVPVTALAKLNERNRQ